ncbi:MAG: YfhO family protein [Bacilli bacterium]|nr:YfhO family protein [Bacilli bacterium]
MREKLPFLFNIRSLFYFFWLVFFIGMAWMAYGLINNSFTQFYPWTDYFGQYVTLTFYYHDVWHGFLKTGYFELYSPNTYLGSDNIGSNSYYGLFDPFLIICYIFPRAWIPQTFALATMVKGAVGAMAMRAYLKYMGLSESSSRVGALAFAFNGWVNYFVGFPSFVSSAFTFPLIMLGIEKVIKERKPFALVMGLFLLGIISFFFLVVACVWGVLYALWRYFWTIKKRNAKENVMVIVLGIAGFAIGIAMSAWTLLPSVRESALSGRTSSIGKGYLDAILNAFKDKDFGTVLGYLFEPVGRNPIREMQALQGFFYPTIGYIELPLAGSGYDSWTSNAFIYTPLVILFFIAFVNSIRNKKIGDIIAVLLCAYLMLTNLAYYMFYAFTGDGYGRWFIVLVPCAIYYACRELDHIKEEKKWVIFTGAFLALALAMMTWILTIIFVQDCHYPVWLDPYWPDGLDHVPFQTVSRDGITRSCLWIVFYQLGMDFAVGMLIFFMKNHKHLSKVLMGIIATETILWGNMSFVYKGTWNFKWWNGGETVRNTLTSYGEKLLEDDPGYYRTYYDDIRDRNSPYIWHTNGCSTFHSLFNYDLSQLNCYIGANRPIQVRDAKENKYAYGEVYTSKSWSTFYGNKRFGTDLALSMKYYAIMREGYGTYEGVADNVPWGSELVYGDNNSTFRLYKNPYVEKMKLGHAVDHIYKRNVVEGSFDQADDFLKLSATQTPIGGYDELMRNDDVLMSGAILEDADADALVNEDSSFAIEPAPQGTTLFQPVYYSGQIYSGNVPNPVDDSFQWWGTWKGREGPGYFADIIEKGVETTFQEQKTYVDSKGNYITTKDGFDINKDFKYKGDSDIVALKPYDGSTYFNDDWGGACFALNYNLRADRYKTRIYMIGDRMKPNGEIEENVLLSYEYWALSNIIGYRIGDTRSCDVFHMYPNGRVKYICFNAKPSDFKEGTFPSRVSVFKAEKSEVDNAFNAISDDSHNLMNVTYDKNKFAFDSNFPTKKVVTTSVGYDAGWSVKAIDENGEVTYPKMLKVNGGLVGFIAPAGKVSYELTYMTPYLKLGALASSGAWFVVAGHSLVVFTLEIKKKRKELASMEASMESEQTTSKPLEKESGQSPLPSA